MIELNTLKPNKKDYKIIRLTDSTNNRPFNNKLNNNCLKITYFVISKQKPTINRLTGSTNNRFSTLSRRINNL